MEVMLSLKKIMYNDIIIPDLRCVYTDMMIIEQQWFNAVFPVFH